MASYVSSYFATDQTKCKTDRTNYSDKDMPNYFFGGTAKWATYQLFSFKQENPALSTPYQKTISGCPNPAG